MPPQRNHPLSTIMGELQGVFLSNTKTRRAKLTADRLQTLADLGLHWAVA
ncbi:hypothetical protein [Streptomyces sp. NPDC000994]